MNAGSPLGRLEAFLAATASVEPFLDGTPVAIGWATVELDRAVAELARETGAPVGSFTSADDDELLGARCRVAPGVLAERRSLVVLEPVTEGRLAATLARHGEGPAAIWIRTTDASPAVAVVRIEALELSAPRRGPLGIERLVRGGPIHGPHRLLVGPPGTIRS